MKVIQKNPPRSFKVGKNQHIILHDMGEIQLAPNEQVTFMTEDQKEYDLCRKDWGYYATPSMNDRLKRFGFKTALVRNSKGQIYIMIVEKEKIDLFNQYILEEDNYVVQWLDEKSLA